MKSLFVLFLLLFVNTTLSKEPVSVANPKPMTRATVLAQLATTPDLNDFTDRFGESAKIDMPLLIWPLPQHDLTNTYDQLANGYWVVLYQRTGEQQEIAAVFQSATRLKLEGKPLITALPDMQVIWPVALTGMNLSAFGCNPHCNRDEMYRLIQSNSYKTKSTTP